MELYEILELESCPKCGGVGYPEEEGDTGVYISCIDCGAHTVVVSARSAEEKKDAAIKAMNLWNSGKAITSERGE